VRSRPSVSLRLLMPCLSSLARVEALSSELIQSRREAPDEDRLRRNSGDSVDVS